MPFLQLDKSRVTWDARNKDEYFAAKKAEVIDKHGKVVTTFWRKGGLYTVDMMLRAPRRTTPKPAAGFAGQGTKR